MNKPKNKDKLYPVTVVEHDASRVKIHYVGYSSEHDEWREGNELEFLDEEETGDVAVSSYHPYSIYFALRVKIKQALTCGRRSSLIVNIVMQWWVKNCWCTIQESARCPTLHYRDLNPILGSSWHFGGLNDYGYVMLDTVDFVYTNQDL